MPIVFILGFVGIIIILINLLLVEEDIISFRVFEILNKLLFTFEIIIIIFMIKELYLISKK